MRVTKRLLANDLAPSFKLLVFEWSTSIYGTKDALLRLHFMKCKRNIISTQVLHNRPTSMKE